MSHEPTGELSPRERLVLAARACRFLRLERAPTPTPWPEAVERLRRVEPGAGWSESSARTVLTRVSARVLPGCNADHADSEAISDESGALDSILVGHLLTSGLIGPADLRLLMW